MRIESLIQIVTCLAVGIVVGVPAAAQKMDTTNANLQAPFVPSRVTEAVNETRLVRLPGNTYPDARPEFERGLVAPDKVLEKLEIVLKRSPEQEAALAAFNERQYDPKSPDFHHWLHAEEFGKLYGPSDADITAVTSWLQNHGFQIDEVAKGRVYIQFTGTVSQLQEAFHLQMHNYLVDGKMHIANDRDPEIPEALSPVVGGLLSLHDFFPKHYSHPGAYVKRDLKTGTYTLLPPSGGKFDPTSLGAELSADPGKYTPKSAPKEFPDGIHADFGYIDASTGYQREDLSPFDVATIYNILPLWNESTPVNGKGVKVAIVALSDVETSDFNTFRSSFGLPVGTLTTLHSGADPGITPSQGENTEDTEMVSATAPGAQVVLVADVNNATTNGLVTSVQYITENEVAPIMTMSYGECELINGTSNNSLFNSIFQQAATAGISSFVAAGDSGSAVCTRQSGTVPYGDQYGLMVSGMASTPYVTAVGGTDLQWPFVSSPYTDFWNTTNAANGSSAKGYMPEMSWNETCTNPILLNVYTSYSSVEALCNAAINADPGLVTMSGGSGGVSNCTTNSTTSSSTTFNPASCSGGYAKPSWQTGVTGIPADGKRDLPDVSMFGAFGFDISTGIPGSALLICQASDNPENSCDYSNPDYIIYQENGGTSAASPMTAGIMALIVQKTGSAQGLANPVLYNLAAKENYASCNSNTVKAGNSCIFYDTTYGSNAMNCYTGDPDCVTKTSGDQSGVLSGYSATVGYDLTTGLGTMNVANLVNAWPTTATVPAVTLSPTSLTFASTAVGSTTTAQLVTVKNSGTAALTVTSETVTGTDASSFIKSATTCGTSLAIGATCTVSVEFKPATAGALTGSVSIADNATGSPQSVTLTGTGAAATAPVVTLSPASLTFASTTVGSKTVAQVVTVKNSGTAAITITSETITGTNATSFLKSATTCGTSLAVGATCTVSVEFKPAAAGTLTAALSIADNATGSPQLVKLTGTGTAATTPTVTVTPTSIAFPAQIVGSTSDAQTVTVKNSGTVAVTLTSIVVSGTNASSFPELNSCGASLAAGASCSLYVAFDPASAATLSGSISITDNASGSPQKVTLTGTGSAAPSVKLSATSVAFPTTTHGTTSEALPVTLSNSGGVTLTLTSITLTGTNPTDFEELNTCGATLAPGAKCVVYVAFKPAAAAAYKATLSIADSGAASPQSVVLTGTGK